MQPWLLLVTLASGLVAAPVQILQVDHARSRAGVPYPSAEGPRLAPRDEQRLQALVLRALQPAVPRGLYIAGVSLASRQAALGFASLPEQAEVDVRLGAGLVVGEQAVTARLHQPQGSRPFRVQVELRPLAHEQGIKRGSDVRVMARTGSVYVQTRGIAQSAAAIGESLVVLCENATRTLVAVAVGPKDVEVEL